MNSSNNSIQLSLIHPDNTIETNGLLDDLFDFRNSDYISPVSNGTVDLYSEPAKNLNIDVKYKIGDGKMDYIKDTLNREMFTNAWKAITCTNNWDFIAQEMECFAFSEDPRIYEITEKRNIRSY